MFNRLFTTLCCCAVLALPLVANSNSQIHAVGNTLKTASQITVPVRAQLAALNINAQDFASQSLPASVESARQQAELRQTENRMQINVGLILVALFCFVMRANRSRV
jgi:hypothetical protein